MTLNPIIQFDGATVFHGSNLDVLPTLPDNSVDSIVTDPPYELGFMGKKWDSTGIAYSVELWQECLRVLKPGGHLLSFGGTRTWHRVAVAIEDAGFDVRDSIAWMYGSGFPKSLDVSKAIDKAAGAERAEKLGSPTQKRTEKGQLLTNQRCSVCGKATFSSNPCVCPRPDKIAITPEAQMWQGWGTALKPAFEPIVVARKPLIGTVAENVLEWGVGGLNIDGSRIGTNPGYKYNADRNGTTFHGGQGERIKQTAEKKGSDVIESTQGRWPANVILDEYSAGILDEQSGVSKSVVRPATGKPHLGKATSVAQSGGTILDLTDRGHNDSGGASRFFYVAKASKRDRNEGLDKLPDTMLTGRDPGQDAMQNPHKTRSKETKNFHPTVKPTDLMRYLIKLVTPVGGVVLDPFTGSGSTGKAALLDGYRFIGIEMTADYLPIIEGRLRHAAATREQALQADQEKEKETLF